MHYLSTRNPEHRVLLSEAIAQGIAPDGGLFVPESFPHLLPHQFDGLTTLPEIGARLIAPFAAGDPLVENDLDAICKAAFAVLKGTKGVDPNRMGVLGFSLGGGVATLLASGQPMDVKSLVTWSSVGDFQADMLGGLGQKAFDRAKEDGVSE